MAKVREKAIKDIIEDVELEQIIRKCKVCHLGMIDQDQPYVLGFNFGYSNKTIWLHGAKEGKKIDVIQANNNVCVYFDTDHELFFRDEPVACSWRWRYRSVLAYGKAIILEDFDQKVEGLNIIMKNFTDRTFEYSKPAINNVMVMKIQIDRWTGRSFEY